MFSQKNKIITILLSMILVFAFFINCNSKNDSHKENLNKIKSRNSKNMNIENNQNNNIVLPEPKECDLSLTDALKLRKSDRKYDLSKSIELDELSSLLFAAQGITHRKFRTAPSAGATYPIDLYLFINRVSGLETGLYKFNVESFALSLIEKTNLSKKLQEACLNQPYVSKSAVAIIFTAVWDRIVPRYGERSALYSHQESGHISQNIFLAAAALNIKGVAIGAFDEKSIAQIISIDQTKENPIYINILAK